MDLKAFTIISREEGISSTQFWTAVNIWDQNPHFVCKRLCGSVSLFRGIVSPSHQPIQLLNIISQVDHNARTNANWCELLRSNGIDVKEHIRYEDEEAAVVLIIKRLIPRKCNKFQAGLDVTIIDKKNDVALFCPLKKVDKQDQDLPSVSVSCVYSIQLVCNEIRLSVMPDEHQLGDETLSSEWLETVLFPKLVKWAKLADPVCSSQVIRSLSLVSIDDYVRLYEELKMKYGKEMVKIWPENTDPAKFVYEDVAIATYLLLLWKNERMQKGRPDWKQSFVDLGCGNGLLVYILSGEGHRGLGIDIRKRGIWDIYPETTQLQIFAINPSEGCVFTNYDWLIGNHSDELTPWIPVLANRSSYECSFFLLPCCFYDFAGNKYQRVDTSRSQYGEYLDFVRKICETCGFHTQIDRLRIPSTKRTCLVGTMRNYLPEDSSSVDLAINTMIDSRCEGWSSFKPRESVEKVRNCTKIEKSIIEDVLLIVMKELLKKQGESLQGANRKWNAGRNVPLKELADAVPKETLLKLKSECGGLQTLLRNKRHLFVVAKGMVCLRIPTYPSMETRSRRSSKNQKAWKKREDNVEKKPCWFKDNHPDGCPLLDKECMFEH